MSNPADLDGKCFAMRGPMRIADPRHTPVRGDLADIRLAGQYFVPHYAVPMPHHIVPDSVSLRVNGRADGEVICELGGSETFNVLDIAGYWAWGQQGERGLVGYVPLNALAAI